MPANRLVTLHDGTVLQDMTDWEALATMTEDELEAAALSDPDCPPAPDNARWIRLRPEDGDTWPERLHKAMERGRAAGRIPPAREAAPGT